MMSHKKKTRSKYDQVNCCDNIQYTHIKYIKITTNPKIFSSTIKKKVLVKKKYKILKVISRIIIINGVT